MFDGIFKVFENELINITCRRTGNILFGRSGKQRNISKHTYKIEVKNTTNGMCFSHHSSLCLDVPCPVDIIFLNNELITTEYSFIIVLPIHIKDIIV